MHNLLLVASLVTIAVSACNEPCFNNGQCSAPCPRCSPEGRCSSGYSCKSICAVNTDCSSDSCSVCAPVGTAFPGEFLCVAGCNQTCSTQADCYGANNFGCGNCVQGKCVKGKYCFDTCSSDEECGTYSDRSCGSCINGKCLANCGSTCTFDAACGNSSCPRCGGVNGTFTCCAPVTCGQSCSLDQDCGGQCSHCVSGKCA